MTQGNCVDGHAVDCFLFAITSDGRDLQTVFNDSQNALNAVGRFIRKYSLAILKYADSAQFCARKKFCVCPEKQRTLPNYVHKNSSGLTVRNDEF